MRKLSFLIEIAIEPKRKSDHEKLCVALTKLSAEDPSFGISNDPESGRIVLRGRDEHHLDDKIGVLKRDHRLDLTVGAPQVVYRETITRAAQVDYTHKKRTGGAGEFARVILEIEPNETGKGYEFESRIAGGAVPKEFIPGVEKGLDSVMTSGVIAGFPVLDVKVALVDVAYHEVDSSVTAFEIAARAALREGLRKAGSVLLEPIMKVKVTAPEDCLRDLIGDLHARRGKIIDTDMRGNMQVVIAIVPLANMFGYVNDLHSMSQGRASHTMQFDHYAPVPWPENDPPFRPAVGMRP